MEASHLENVAERASSQSPEVVRVTSVPPRPFPTRSLGRRLVVADALALTAAFLATLAVGYHPITQSASNRTALVLCLLTLPVWLAVAAASGLYGDAAQPVDRSTAEELLQLARLVATAAWIVPAVAVLRDGRFRDFDGLLILVSAGVVALVAGRVIVRSIARGRASDRERVVIVGAGDVGCLIAEKLRRRPELGMDFIGFVDSDPPDRIASAEGSNVLGPVPDLLGILREREITRVIVAFSSAPSAENVALLRDVSDQGTRIDIVPRLYEAIGPVCRVTMLEGFPLVSLGGTRQAPGAAFIKRAIDVVCAGAGLVAISPLLLYIAIRIKLDSPGPVFYRHDRIGRYGVRFKMLKFRTMYTDSSQQGVLDEHATEAFRTNFKLRDDPRITPYGATLRRKSFDELPQLVNILKGELSLVGPRPLPYDGEIELYGDNAQDLLRVVPGLTGLWQISGRSDLSYEERVRLDMAYVHSHTLALDFVILLKTVRMLLSGSGAY